MAAPAEEPRRLPRTEEQILGALAGNAQSGLAVVLGGEPRHLRPLTLKTERLWRESVAKQVQSAASTGIDLENLDDAETIGAVLGMDPEGLLDLVLEFDAHGAGTLNRAWLEDNARTVELRDTLEVLLDSVYPPLPGGQVKPGSLLLSILIAGAAAKSVQAASTSGSSRGTPGSTARRTSKRR